MSCGPITKHYDTYFEMPIVGSTLSGPLAKHVANIANRMKNEGLLCMAVQEDKVSVEFARIRFKVFDRKSFDKYAIPIGMTHVISRVVKTYLDNWHMQRTKRLYRNASLDFVCTGDLIVKRDYEDDRMPLLPHNVYLTLSPVNRNAFVAFYEGLVSTIQDIAFNVILVRNAEADKVNLNIMPVNGNLEGTGWMLDVEARPNPTVLLGMMSSASEKLDKDIVYNFIELANYTEIVNGDTAYYKSQCSNYVIQVGERMLGMINCVLSPLAERELDFGSIMTSVFRRLDRNIVGSVTPQYSEVYDVAHQANQCGLYDDYVARRH